MKRALAIACAALLAACGEPNAPRTDTAEDAEAAHPDLSGVWLIASPPMFGLGQYVDLPLTPEARERVEAHRALVDPLGETSDMYCLTAGMPEMMMGGGRYPIEIIQTDEQITLISEIHSDTRRFFLGERIADDADIFPSRRGYSRGRWEGDVLVVETTHLQEQVDSRYPHSGATRIVERFSLTEAEDGTPRLVADTVVTDPDWWTAPLSYRLEWAPYEIGWLMPFDCNEPAWLDRLEALAAGANDPAP